MPEDHRIPGSSSGPVSIANIIASSPASTVSRTASTLKQSLPVAAPGDAAIPMARGYVSISSAVLKRTSIRSCGSTMVIASSVLISLFSALVTEVTMLSCPVKLLPLVRLGGHLDR